MNNVIDFIQINMNYLNDIQSYHWQTESFSEHENTGEYYDKFNKLNDEFVETWQGKTGTRIKFSAELRPGIMNYADNSQVRGEVQKQVARITKISQHPKVVNQMDLESILEDMLLATNQLLFHLSLK
tara:strand:- start:81 stop:461 length:381 start_codon:yes stop_codon:yes gene_type:complete